MTYQVYKIPTEFTRINVGKIKKTNHYVILVKEENQDTENVITRFAIEFDGSKQVEAYIDAMNIILRKMKKEGM